ncbi:MAG: hypothetical protein DMF70_01960 [Acidobacteria bacterium]|nr:MAG: hypothetical protein DMF70_01960 [Acidobacteriota bacterium]
MIGQLCGNYKILQKLGAGGQGTVYKATDNKLGRTVVLKVLPAELTVKETNLKRFAREARLASALDHPNICTIFDLDEAEGLHFIAMQHVEGKNVRQLVNGRPLELESALRIGIQVADALTAAHARGIIHRDIKSGNVMVTDSGQVKVLDFGLAKLLDETEAQTSGIHQTELTEVGVPYGTATYAAPKQARGDRVDASADICSTGRFAANPRSMCAMPCCMTRPSRSPKRDPAQHRRACKRFSIGPWPKIRAVVTKKFQSCATSCAKSCKRFRQGRSLK